MSKLVAQGSKYDDEIRRKAVSEYSLCGSLAKVSEATGVSRRTLADWRGSDWWDQLLRQEDGELVSVVGEGGEVPERAIAKDVDGLLTPFYDGHPGYNPTSYTPQEMADTISDYFLAVIQRGEELVITDISIGLRMHRDTIHSYFKGEIGKTPELKKQFSDVIKWAYQIVENGREKLLTREKGQVAGTIFALKHHHGYRDTQHIQVDTHHHTAVVMLPPDLVAKMNKAAGIIEGECEQIEK